MSGPVVVDVDLRGRPFCSECNGPTVAQLKVNATGDGWEAGEVVKHADWCPALQCEHGVRVWGPRLDCALAACSSNRGSPG